MPRHYVRKPASWTRREANARTDLGEESKARALARSRAKCQIHPLIAREDGLLIDGYRTIWGLELEGMLDVELDFIVTDEELTPDQIRVMQANSAFHREPLADFDKALVMKDTLAANPGMSKKQMAEGVFDIDPSLATRYLAIFDSIAEVQYAAKAGKLSVSKWYAISKADRADQPEMLAKEIGGASRDELEQEARRMRGERNKREQSAERSMRVKIPLAVTTNETTAHGTVTVASLPGQEIDLQETEGLLKEALKAVKEARSRGIGLRAAQAAWRDLAAKRSTSH